MQYRNIALFRNLLLEFFKNQCKDKKITKILIFFIYFNFI